jgi:SpoVK/Ycf46/Vps4 family AAA+-type ATPase
MICVSCHAGTRTGLYSDQLRDVLKKQVLSSDEAVRAIKHAVILHAASSQQQSLDTNTNTASSSSFHKLSLWSLDAGISSVMHYPIPLVSSSTNSNRQINTLTQTITDKHEKGLLSNVIAPNDIHVSYDMIGGLEETKEILRQCITYPLKYPRLYQVYDYIAALQCSNNAAVYRVIGRNCCRGDQRRSLVWSTGHREDDVG